MLQKTRGGKSVDFTEMSNTLRDVIDANIFIVSRKGKLLGFSINQQIENERMKKMLEERQFPVEYTENLFHITSTTTNLDINSEYTAFPVENKELFRTGLTTIVPIIGGGERLGTLILSRLSDSFNEDDLILAENGATVVGWRFSMRKQSK